MTRELKFNCIYVKLLYIFINYKIYRQFLCDTLKKGIFMKLSTIIAKAVLLAGAAALPLAAYADGTTTVKVSVAGPDGDVSLFLPNYGQGCSPSGPSMAMVTVIGGPPAYNSTEQAVFGNSGTMQIATFRNVPVGPGEIDVSVMAPYVCHSMQSMWSGMQQSMWNCGAAGGVSPATFVQTETDYTVPTQWRGCSRTS